MYIKVKVTVQMRKDMCLLLCLLFVNNKLKNFCCFQKGIPTKVINSLKDLTDLQLNYIGLMFK